jgi:hypothetical protein
VANIVKAKPILGLMMNVMKDTFAILDRIPNVQLDVSVFLAPTVLVVRVQ